MSLFHDEENGPSEPIPGLPEHLPEGETILWQGRPSAIAMMFGTFRLRWVLAYFVIMTSARIANMSANGGTHDEMTTVVLSSAVMCAIAVSIIGLLAWAMSRAAIFTLTDQRIVIRFGAALRKYINAPFAQMESAQLKRRSARIGDIALQLDASSRIGYFRLWPFARPFTYLRAQPMLRGLKDAEKVAALLARAVREYAPDKVTVNTIEQSPVKVPNDLPEATAPA